MKQENNRATREKRMKKQSSIREIVDKIITCKSKGQLVFRCIMMILVPYIYLYVCGILDSVLLRNGFAFREQYILFVFFSLMIFWAIGITLGVMAMLRFARARKQSGDKQQEKKHQE